MSQLYGTLTPAYGRNYQRGDAALKDWNNGRDFMINNPVMSTYCGIRDTANCPVGHSLQIRWANLTEVTVIKKMTDGSYAGDMRNDSEM